MEKKEVKSKTEMDQSEARSRIESFNKELAVIAQKYQVKLDVSMRVVIVDDKPQKTSK